MGLYSEWIFPKFFDVLVRHKYFDAKRVTALKEVKGKVLEIGIGTGLNLDCYPSAVREIYAIDPNPGMKRELFAKHSDHRVKIHFSQTGAENLPYDSETFDTIVSTLTFCSIPDLPAALAEMKRVLKTKGKIIFMEHGLSHERSVAKWQRRLDPIQKVVGCGCSLTVNATDELKRAGFNVTRGETYYVQKAPKFVGYVYEGIAVKGH